MNILPIAVTTDPAEALTDIEGLGVTFYGVAGPGVSNGFITNYHFEYGLSTSYGTSTPSGTIGSCPPGVPSGSPYCAVPPAVYVHFDAGSLLGCARYHYRVVASNPDGVTDGLDRILMTEFVSPMSSIHAPKRVKHHHRFRVTVHVVNTATFTVELKLHGRTVKTFHEGVRSSDFTQRIRAPRKKGRYTIKVTGREACGVQYLRTTINVR